MSGVITGGGGVPGNVWGTDSAGIATPQVGRPAMTGGLQPLAMLQAFRAGAGMDQLQAMNPYTARPTQFLPQALPTIDYAAQYRAQQPLAVSPFAGNQLFGMDGGGGPGGGIGIGGSGAAAAAASSDNGQDGSASAVGGGDGGSGGSK